MRSIKPLIAGNGIALFLTIVCLLPITAIFALAASAPLDDAMANLGMWLHNILTGLRPNLTQSSAFLKLDLPFEL